MKSICRSACGVFTGAVIAATPFCYGETPQPSGDSLHSAATSLAGFDTLAGDLPGVVAAQSKPYLVAGDIYVPQGKTVMIEAGAILLFKNFSGLHVSGILLARGTKEKPIVFTSENDREYNRQCAVDPAPFDWNGLYIHEDGIGTHLAYCAVLYSVEGIVSLTKFIRLNTCLFLHNGRANLTVEGVRHTVGDQPYDYALSTRDPSLLNVPANILRDPQAASRVFLRYSGVAAAVTGCIMGLVGGSKFNSSSHELHNLSALTDDNLSRHSGSAWNSARTNRNRNFATMIAGLGVAAVGAVGIGWSFTF